MDENVLMINHSNNSVLEKHYFSNTEAAKTIIDLVIFNTVNV